MSDGTSIFDLDPESFRIYFEEGRRDRSPEQNEFLLQEYRRRSSPLSELYERAPKTPPGRRRLGILPMTVPEGMTGMEAIRSGEFEFGYPGALTEMSDTLRDVIDMPGATLRGPVSATELTEAGVGAGEMLASGLGSAALKQAFRSSDARQLERFEDFQETHGAYGTRGYDAIGTTPYIPSEDELSMMRSNPTQAEQMYMQRVATSRQMAASGNYTDDDILSQTGILRIPIRGAEDNLLGVREVFAADPTEFEELRPGVQYDIQDVPRADIDGSSGVFFDTPTKRIEIADDLSPEERDMTETHEKGHWEHSTGMESPDFFTQLRSRPETGSNPDVELSDLRERVQDLRTAIRDPARASEREELRRQLQTILQTQSARVNYLNNPGEILARLTSGEDYTVALGRPADMFNPYFVESRAPKKEGQRPRAVGPVYRGLGSLSSLIRPDLTFSDEALEAADRLGFTTEPPIHTVPLDTSKGRITTPHYQFAPR